MLTTVEACRHLWNDALSHRKWRWEEERKSTSYSLQQWILTAVRNANPELRQVHSQVAQDVLHRLDRAFRAFFNHTSRYPKFKKYKEYGSFTYPQAYNGSARPDILRKRLYLSKVGNIKAVFHRPIPKDAMLKTCTVTRESCGEWYASLVYVDVVPLQNVTVPITHVIVSPVGIDLGLKALVTTSDGQEVKPPKFLRKAEKRLKYLQRELSRKKPGSKNRWKARKRVASLHAKVARQRVDFNHKLSSRLVREHDLIVFEDLRIGNMVRDHTIAKSIADAGWRQLVAFTKYKATRHGRVFQKVPAPGTTQECFWCGVLNKVDRGTREFVCVGCGRTLRRDLNAARIVLKRALAQVGQGMPELKPVETRPLPWETTPTASPVVEAGIRSPRP